MKEIEAKFRLYDISLIGKAGLIKVKTVHIVDIYFDHEVLDLKSQDKVLRVRKENDTAYIAFKGPREKHYNLIIREEIEPEISSFEDGMNIAHGLGFHKTAQVEKTRTYYSSQAYPQLSITIDHYPFIGDFIEIEGDESKVNAFLEEYGFNMKEIIQKSCSETFVEYCDQKKLPFERPLLHFTFQDEADFNY
jgi:predicted adenylyl cyclase CyaB